jgi:outer membrane receptor protein involved in Fe transport
VHAFLLIAALLLPASGSSRPTDKSPVELRGEVTDASGSGIGGASVSFITSETHFDGVTQPDGRFDLQVPAGGGTLAVKAAGFAIFNDQVEVSSTTKELSITLRPAGPLQQVTVTAGRQELRVAETVPVVSVLNSQDIRTSGAVALDDVMRQLPIFDLFRRSSSLVSNPTSQGVSLRGIGASGSSRALVLRDGIPLNDPFGGWVYWDRVPRAAIDRVEVVHGGQSDLYGSSALGGVMNVLSTPPRVASLDLTGSYGQLQTGEGSMNGTLKAGRWGFGLAGEAFNTGGYVLVPQNQRGPVDIAANSRHREGEAIVDREVGADGRVFLRGSLFGESRGNGKIGEGNDTGIRELAAGWDTRSQSLGNFALRLFGSSQRYDQSFFSVNADRTQDSLIRLQRVPAQQVGGSAQWNRTLGTRNTLLAGFDYRDVKGFSRERAINNSVATSLTTAGGRQRNQGIFFAHRFQATSRLLITDGLRADFFSNNDASSSTQVLTKPSPLVITPFADREESAVNPSLGLLYRAMTHLSFTATGYRAFRTPTLNELYRSFRLGNVLTQANDRLRAERLTGAEGGAVISGLGDKLALRATYFFEDVLRPVGNITLSSTPALITRQRQNIGRTQSSGVEFAGEWQPRRDFFFSVGYQFVNAKVTDFSANPGLVGLFVPEVPQHRLGFSIRYDNPRYLTVAFEGRASGRQFDDDQNTLPLDRYATVDLYVSRRLVHGAEMFVSVQNLTNEQYLTALTVPAALGTPRLARAGLKLHFGGR